MNESNYTYKKMTVIFWQIGKKNTMFLVCPSSVISVCVLWDGIGWKSLTYMILPLSWPLCSVTSSLSLSVSSQLYRAQILDLITHNLKFKDSTLHPHAPVFPGSLPLYTESSHPSSWPRSSIHWACGVWLTPLGAHIPPSLDSPSFFFSFDLWV